MSSSSNFEYCFPNEIKQVNHRSLSDCIHTYLPHRIAHLRRWHPQIRSGCSLNPGLLSSNSISLRFYQRRWSCQLAWRFFGCRCSQWFRGLSFMASNCSWFRSRSRRGQELQSSAVCRDFSIESRKSERLLLLPWCHCTPQSPDLLISAGTPYPHFLSGSNSVNSKVH